MRNLLLTAMECIVAEMVNWHVYIYQSVKLQSSTECTRNGEQMHFILDHTV
jgi:hypothetical protein